MPSKAHEVIVSETVKALNRDSSLLPHLVSGLSDEDKLAARLGKKVVVKDGDDWLVVVYRPSATGTGAYFWKEASGTLLRQLLPKPPREEVKPDTVPMPHLAPPKERIMVVPTPVPMPVLVRPKERVRVVPTPIPMPHVE